MKFCDKPFTSVYLAPHGEVWPCGWMHYTIGNLYEQDLDEIWTSETARLARESILDGSFAFCRAISCPFMERNDLPDLTEEDIEKCAVPLDTPAHITIANDRTCNIACTSCRKCISGPDREEREKIDRVLRRLIPFADRAKSVGMNGQGEFLANPSFVNLLNQLRPVHEDFWISFESNGILFDEEHWAKFSHLSNYNMSATITLNSINRETYRYLTGGFDHLAKELDNLRFLGRLRRENKLKALTITMVAQECNFWEIPEYIHTFTSSPEFEIDTVEIKPIYNWFKMDPETYWFKNIRNPLHPYHKEYLKILEDDCWKEPKVYDWGCHNILPATPHPLSQEKIYNRLLLDIYQNEQGLTPAEFLRVCMARTGGKRVGYYGKNDFSKAMAKMLLDAGIDLAFQITWNKEEDDDFIPKIVKQDFRPDMADVMLIIDFHKGHYWFKDLPALGFRGPVLSIEEFIEGAKT